ncbi:MAG: hypothetical protein KGY80_08030 [Candidatus Thorarchaeota archaeon]|nr:hypothetical protein [Candidatus Thorarchaeota archaeon]
MKSNKLITRLFLVSLGVIVLAMIIQFITIIGNHPSRLIGLATNRMNILGPLQEDVSQNTWLIIGLAFAATLSLSLPALAAAMGMTTTSSAALGAITERPELFGKTVLYVVFIEAIAIYGFVISFLLTGYIANLIG